LQRIENAVQLFYGVQEPDVTARQIARLHRNLGRAAGRRRSSALYWALSPPTRELLAEYGIAAPDQNDADAAEKLRSGLITSGKWRQDRGQRRWVETLVGKQARGRPTPGRMTLLVSMLAEALAATGKPVTRSRGTSPPTIFERLIHSVLVALGIDDVYEVTTLARQHFEMRLALERTRFEASIKSGEAQ
jgi:hypothetical protein